MALDYTTFVTAFSANLVVPSTDAAFLDMVPRAIDDAEQRIYRDLDLLATVTTDITGAATTSNRNFTLPGGNAFRVIQDINIITPAGTTNPELGTRNPVLPVSREVLDMLYPSVASAGVPQYFARVTQSTLVFGPWPLAAYTVEVVGTQFPPPLSATNTTTFLTTYLPDVFLAAAMVYGAAWQQNFSASGDNPQQAVNWESHYKTLLASATIEEIRKKFGSEGWSDRQPDPIATPPRT